MIKQITASYHLCHNCKHSKYSCLYHCKIDKTMRKPNGLVLINSRWRKCPCYKCYNYDKWEIQDIPKETDQILTFMERNLHHI